MHRHPFLPAVVSIALGLIFMVPASIVHASFDDDYQLYLKNYDNYRRAYDYYVVTRNQYLTFGTLNAKTDALTSVKNFMTVRDDVLISYLGLLHQKSTDNVFNQLLVGLQTFLHTHKEKISATVSLDDAVNISQELESRNLEMQITARKTVGSILTNKVEELNSQCALLVKDAQTILANIKTSGKNINTLERWLLDAKNKQGLAEQNLAQIHIQLTNFNSNTLDAVNEDFNKIQFSIFEANQYLREAFNFLTEFKESIKYGSY